MKPEPLGPSRLALLGVALALLLPAPAAGGGEDPPRIRFEETTHDFGKIPSDRKVSHRFVFHNEGRQSLQILGTRPSCGCTATVLESPTIPPGEKGTLEVTFDPAGQHGSVRKSLAVTSNDPAATVVRLTLKAEVTPTSSPDATKDGHPPVAGQSLLMGSCASCHAAPASGKSEDALYRAVCAMCHGPTAEGGLAPSLRDRDYLGSRDDQELFLAIAYGTANPRMPGFSADMGGPLDAAQIRSVVELLRRWGPVSATRDANGSKGIPPGR